MHEHSACHTCPNRAGCQLLAQNYGEYERFTKCKQYYDLMRNAPADKQIEMIVLITALQVESTERTSRMAEEMLREAEQRSALIQETLKHPEPAERPFTTKQRVLCIDVENLPAALKKRVTLDFMGTYDVKNITDKLSIELAAFPGIALSSTRFVLLSELDGVAVLTKKKRGRKPKNK